MRKWAGRRAARYRNEFRRQLPQVLATSSVFGLALSVQGGSVVDSLPELITQMGLDRDVIVSGPEIRIVGLASGHDFTIKEAQAAYAIYLLHFICRMHASILETLLDDDGAPLATCDWQISPDNFTGDFNGPMAKLFSVTANSAAMLGLVRGNLRVSTHYVKGDPGADLCDNLAGMLRDDLARGSSTLTRIERPAMGGLYWEIHCPKECIKAS